eukprot:CAMPEP_0194716500 /NCGR_PEP_ID=MMETSP0296-20130528/8220_1 /TAXON_ID=39354 /ORGANISM="Heterosigma akashiwo, Strain CCMP2393" /LENGTH=90 /DNA_ID=CAMNT_0039616923 /DNA_START=174 /DNA_END=442 /DNA_ORIENTATION=+
MGPHCPGVGPALGPGGADDLRAAADGGRAGRSGRPGADGGFPEPGSAGALGPGQRPADSVSALVSRSRRGVVPADVRSLLQRGERGPGGR